MKKRDRNAAAMAVYASEKPQTRDDRRCLKRVRGSGVSTKQAACVTPCVWREQGEKEGNGAHVTQAIITDRYSYSATLNEDKAGGAFEAGWLDRLYVLRREQVKMKALSII